MQCSYQLLKQFLYLELSLKILTRLWAKKKKKGRKKGGKKRGHMTSKNKGTVKMKYTKKLWRKLFFIALVNRSFWLKPSCFFWLDIKNKVISVLLFHAAWLMKLKWFGIAKSETTQAWNKSKFLINNTSEWWNAEWSVIVKKEWDWSLKYLDPFSYRA